MRSYIRSIWPAFELRTFRNISAADNVYIFFDIPISFALKSNPIIKNRVTPSFCDFIKLYTEQ